MSEPTGLRCPGCEEPAMIVLDSGRQALCGNDQCHVMQWNPELTLAELHADMGQIDLPDWLPPTTEHGPRYFGPPILRKPEEVQVDTPVGALCLLCAEPIAEGDAGTTINYVGQITHYECTFRQVVGSVGHQQGQCSCYGGTSEDPPGLTRRQAAIDAAQLWEASQR